MADEPWVPDEPAAAWPPDAVPVVVSAWERSPGGARARPLARMSYAVLLKRDVDLHRARQFADAWRSLLAARRLRDPRHLERLCAAGVIVPGRRAPSGDTGGGPPRA